jgi:hypothetical protein
MSIKSARAFLYWNSVLLGTYLALSTILQRCRFSAAVASQLTSLALLSGVVASSQFGARKNVLQKLFRHLIDSAGQ